MLINRYNLELEPKLFTDTVSTLAVVERELMDVTVTDTTRILEISDETIVPIFKLFLNDS